MNVGDVDNFDYCNRCKKPRLDIVAGICALCFLLAIAKAEGFKSLESPKMGFKAIAQNDQPINGFQKAANFFIANTSATASVGTLTFSQTTDLAMIQPKPEHPIPFQIDKENSELVNKNLIKEN